MVRASALRRNSLSLLYAISIGLRSGEYFGRYLSVAPAFSITSRTRGQTTAPKPHTDLQGEGGACGPEGRSNTGSACGAVRRPPQSNHIVEGAARGRGNRSFRSRR